MAKSKTSNVKANGTSQKSNRVGAKRFFQGEVLVAFLFALVFGGIGGYLIASGHAQGSGCVARTFEDNSYYINTYEPCVNDAQGMLNTMHYSDGVTPLISTDGYFGPNTRAAVKDFQSAFMPVPDRTGVLNPNTWNSLCNYDSIAKGGHPGVSWHGADCQSVD